MKTIRLTNTPGNSAKNFSQFFCSVGVVLLFFGVCQASNVEGKMGPLDQISQQQWDKLSQKKIFFGHQSVGNNIIDGINKIELKKPYIHLNIVRTKNKSDFNKPVFAHFAIGKNDYPLTKIKDFIQIMDNVLGNKVDICFMKFCFVDITSATDIENVFEKYQKNIRNLKAHFPKMIVVHFTVPLLKKEKVGVVLKTKNFFRGLIGKKKDSFFSSSHNVVRNEYNRLLVNHYDGKEPIFDLARLESTDPSGQRETFSSDGKDYCALVPAYTEDGGHLNEQGRKYIAEQLLIFLANL